MRQPLEPPEKRSQQILYLHAIKLLFLLRKILKSLRFIGL
jgi:hypothetical protein